MKHLVLLSFLMINVALAGEFSKLKAEKIEQVARDPFANRKFRCETTFKSGLKTAESWQFFKTQPGSFTRSIGGLVNSGRYSVSDGVLSLQEVKSVTSMGKEIASDKSWAYKYKLTSVGFEYIHETKSGKLLYECIISGSTAR